LEENLYHHGLVKIILVEVLKDKKKMWEEILAKNYFSEDVDSDSLESMEEKLAKKPRKKPWTRGPQTKEKEKDEDFNASEYTEEKLAEKLKKKKPRTHGLQIKEE